MLFELIHSISTWLKRRSYWQLFSDMGWVDAKDTYMIADEGFPKASINVDKIFRWTFHFPTPESPCDVYNQLFHSKKSLNQHWLWLFYSLRLRL